MSGFSVTNLSIADLTAKTKGFLPPINPQAAQPAAIKYFAPAAAPALPMLAADNDTTPTKAPQANKQTTPLSQKSKSALVKDLKKCLEERLATHTQKSSLFVEEIFHTGKFAGLPKELAESLTTLFSLQKMAITYPALKQSSQKSVSEFLTTVVPDHILKWLDEVKWSDDNLLKFSVHLGIKVPLRIFIRVRIQNGKILWKLFHEGFGGWFCNNKNETFIIQGIKRQNLIKTTENPTQEDYVDLSLERFVSLKNAGKRNSFDTVTLLGGTPILNRMGRNKTFTKTPTARWDVATYSELASNRDTIDKSKKLEMDHIPQDKWLLKAFYEIPDLIFVAHELKNLARDQYNPKSFLLTIKGKPDLFNSEKMKAYFPVLATQKFKDLLLNATTPGKNFTQPRIDKLQPKINELIPHIDVQYINDLINKLEAFENTLTPSGFAISVPQAIHRLSRTYLRPVTEEIKAQGQDVLRETLLDHTNYQDVVFFQIFGEEFYKDFVAVGAFRYHYRMIVKHTPFKVQINTPTTQDYDKKLLGFVKEGTKHA